MENYQNLVGRLLAGENINIVQKRMDTAAFDIKNRTLYLPIWKDMTPEINDMLICHEVSHALFTPMDYVDALDKKLKFKNARSYLNILEDIRVEKLIKRRYPGIKKSFSLGYKQLNEKDFFGIKSKNLAESHLMDKINLFYKVGYDCGVKFTAEEKVFVDRAAKTESIHDVIKLAEDIFNFIKESKQVEEKDSGCVELPSQDEDSEIMTLGDTDGDSDDESQDGESSEAESTSGSGDESGEEPEASDGDYESDSDGESESDEPNEGDINKEDADGGSNGAGYTDEIKNEDPTENKEVSDEEFDDGEITTEDSFSNNSKSLIVTSEEREYIDIDEQIKNRIVPFNVLLKSYNIAEMSVYQKKLIEDFYTNNKDAVNYLVKEFEMKKAATSYKKATVAKSGLIDARKLYAYKIKDDLFRRISVSADGKNHGIVMLLDWSGSMHSCIKDAVEQIAVLAMFCKRINIPFQVLAFADGSCPKEWNDYYTREGWNSSNNVASEKHKSYFLVELFSHKMSNGDFKRVIELCLTGSIQHIFGLNGTPLTESLIYMYSYLKKFRMDNNVEKLSFITVTDGEGSTFAGCSSWTSDFDQNGKRITKKYFLRVPSTKKVIEIDDSTASQSSAILQAIKERYDCNVIGFFITPNQKGQIGRFLSVTYRTYDYYKKEEEIKAELKKNDICCLTDVPGRDMVFVLPTSKLKVNNDTLEINSNANAKKIAATFCKHLNKKKTSRVLLDKLIGIIA